MDLTLFVTVTVDKQSCPEVFLCEAPTSISEEGFIQ